MGRYKGYIGHRVPQLKLTELRGLIAARFSEGGPYELYRRFSLEGLIPLKSDGEHLDISGFRRVHRQVAKDRNRNTSDFAVRFLYRCTVAAMRESRGRYYTMREVSHMLGLQEPIVKDILINHGDI